VACIKWTIGVTLSVTRVIQTKQRNTKHQLILISHFHDLQKIQITPYVQTYTEIKN